MRQSRLTGELTPPLHHFVREQEEQPSSTCRFGMAEQAINTIYLLGEQPDLLCSDMLKHLTANVFITPPSDLPNPDGSGMGMDADSSATLPSTPLKNHSSFGSAKPRRHRYGHGHGRRQLHHPPFHSAQKSLLDARNAIYCRRIRA